MSRRMSGINQVMFGLVTMALVGSLGSCVYSGNPFILFSSPYPWLQNGNNARVEWTPATLLPSAQYTGPTSSPPLPEPGDTRVVGVYVVRK